VPKTKENPTASKKQQVAEVASRRDVHAAFSWLRAHEREITEAQMELARVPAPPFGEQKDQQKRPFWSEGIPDRFA